MTAINIVLTHETAHLFCDSKAAFNGLHLAEVVKCLPVPHLNAAIATRGEARALAAVHMMASNAATLADLRKQLPVALRLAAKTDDTFLRAAGGELDVFVIAYERKPSAFAIFTHSKHGYAPYSIVEIEGGAFTPTIPTARFNRLQSEHAGPAIGLAALHIQSETDPLTVGGHAQETIVDEGGIHTRTLGKLGSNA